MIKKRKLTEGIQDIIWLDECLRVRPLNDDRGVLAGEEQDIIDEYMSYDEMTPECLEKMVRRGWRILPHFYSPNVTILGWAGSILTVGNIVADPGGASVAAAHLGPHAAPWGKPILDPHLGQYVVLLSKAICQT